MSKITPLMTALHMGYKAEERIKCIDNMLFKKCEDTKETILQAFWWYRKNSIPLEEVKQAREEIEDRIDNYPDRNISEYEDCLAILDKLIESKK